MSKKERVFRYARELNHLIKQANETSGQVDALTGNIQISEKLKDTDRATAFAKQRMEMRKVFEAVAEVIQDKTNRADVEGAEKLLQQLSARIEALGQLEQQVYQMEAALELNVSTGSYGSEAERAEHEQALAKSREHIEKQLELADALIPNKAIILTV